MGEDLRLDQSDRQSRMTLDAPKRTPKTEKDSSRHINDRMENSMRSKNSSM